MKTAVMVLLLLSVSSLLASPTTGSVSGVVTDSTGAVLRGVTLTVSGSDLQGTRRVVSDERGEYRFVLLPPGDRYEINATLAGFERLTVSGVKVSLGKGATLNLTLRAALSAEVTVTTAPPLVDTTGTTSSTTITAAQIDAFPTRRDFQQLTVLAPGAVFDRSKINPAISGATHLENDYIIEGISTRDPSTGRSATNLTMNFVREVEVTTGGYSAEYGRALGGIVNVVSNAGSNAFHGDLLAYFENDEWASKRVTGSFRGSTSKDLGRDKRDWALSLSGPAKRDRVWFFTAYAPRYDHSIRDLVDVRFNARRREPFEITEVVYAAKITSSIGEAHSLTVSGFGNPTEERGWYHLPQADPTAARATQHSGSRNASLRYDTRFGGRVTVDAVLGRHQQQSGLLGDTETGRTVPAQVQWGPSGGFQFIHGGIGWLGTQNRRRESFSAKASVYLQEHALRFGADVERNRFSSSELANIFFFERALVSQEIGVQDVLSHEYVDFSGYGTNNGTALFVHDQWRIAANVYVNAGLRWEQQVISSGRGVTLAVGAAADATPIRQRRRSFAFDDNWAPRLGVAWDPSARGRTKLYAAAGRYYESLPVGINVYVMNGYSVRKDWYYSLVRHTNDNWWNPSGSPLNSNWILFRSSSFRDPEEPSPIDPRTKLQHQDEFSVGGEQAVGTAWTFGARLVARDVRRAIDDMFVHDPNSPTRRRGRLIANPGETSYGIAVPRPSRSYRAVEVTAQRRLSDRWQLVSSFVSARARGNYDGYYEYATYIDTPAFANAFDRPRWMVNTTGRLRADRPYQFKLHSSYAFPFGLTVSEGLIFSSGIPISAVVQPGPVYLTPRGSEGRTPPHWTADLHAEWRVPIRSTRASLVVDVFNATDNHAALEVDEVYVYRGMPGGQEWFAPGNLDPFNYPRYDASLPASPYFKTPSRYQQPRAIQVGVKLSY